MNLLHGSTLASAIAAICVVFVAARLAAFFRDRRRYQNLPGPPCSPIFGHIISMGKTAMKLPRSAHPQLLLTQTIRDLDLPPVFYLDPRPVSDASLVVTDPEVARQVVEADLDKHPALVQMMEPIVGKVNLVTSSGMMWKKWRAAFNPGFSTQHLIGQVPMIIDCCHDFVKLLDEHASADRVFRMEEEATKITFDVIGKTICGHDLKCLTTGSEFMSWMRGAVSWAENLSSMNPFHRYSLLRPFVMKYYRTRMVRYIGKILDERFTAGRCEDSTVRKQKTGVDLALNLFLKTNSGKAQVAMETMDAEFRQAAIDNLLVFLLAGHDTTSSTLCYCYNLLWQHPHTLAAARQELDDVFGANTSAAEQLRETPFLINRLDYLLAVIKEVLRLWPPASTAKQGRKGFFVHDPVSGEDLPTEGVLVWIPSFAIGRSQRIWGEDVDQFKPERFLPGSAAKVPADAWRPFEKGSRNCIGQELTLIELKTVLALTLREFDVRAAFDELASLSNDGTLWTKDSSFRKGPQEAFGDSMYQVLLTSAKPREGMPSRIKRRKDF